MKKIVAQMEKRGVKRIIGIGGLGVLQADEEAADLADTARECMAALPPAQRVVMELRCIEGKSTEEIAEARPTLFASINIQLAEGVDQGGASFVYLGYHLWLDGPDPNVRRLTCRGGYADPASALPPSINQIRQALGDVMTLGPTALTDV